LSLWLMVFAVISAAATTLLPWLGIQWLKLEEKGWRPGYWLAMLLQVASWGTFGYALLLRLERNMPPFHTWITLTTLLWAIWLWVFIYSRHAFRPQRTDDTLEDTQPAFSLDKKCEE
jgi:Na+/proline symporter